MPRYDLLKRKLSTEEYKRIVPGLQARLYEAEEACWQNGLSTLIEGWDAAGKGTTIRALTQRLMHVDFNLYPITAPRTYEQHRPWMWRFWLRVLNRG